MKYGLKRMGILITTLILIFTISGCGILEELVSDNQAKDTINNIESDEDNKKQSDLENLDSSNYETIDYSQYKLSKGNKIVSSDNYSSMLIPKDWEEINNLNNEAVISVGSEKKEQYTIVLSESKGLFSEEITIDDYRKIVIDSIISNLSNYEFVNPKKTTIDDKEAIEVIVHGEINKIKISYIITVVKGEENFYQIVSWTLQNKFEDYKNIFRGVIATFEEQSSISTSDNNTSENKGSQSYKKIVSNNGLAEFSVPEQWKKDTGSDGEVELSMLDAINDKFLMLISESKDIFSEDITLEDYNNMVVELMESNMDTATFTKPLNINIQDYDALQFEIIGQIQKVKIAYLVTIVETNDNFYQIVGWTSQQDFSKYKEELSRIANSFIEK